jgi:hypothetical protein
MSYFSSEKHFFLTSFFALLSLFFANSVLAEIYSVDSINFGANSLTYDSTQDLYFLDVNLTQQYSYNYIEDNLKLGGALEGYRYATTQEISRLTNNWMNYGDTIKNDRDWLSGLVDLLGVTEESSGVSQTWGFTQGATLGRDPVPQDRAPGVRIMDYPDIPNNGDQVRYQSLPRNSIETAGHFLVEDDVTFYGVFIGVNDPPNRNTVANGESDALSLMGAFDYYLDSLGYEHELESYFGAYNLEENEDDDFFDPDDNFIETGGLDLEYIKEIVSEKLSIMDANDVFIFYTSSHGGEASESSAPEYINDEFLLLGEDVLTDDTLASLLNDYENLQKWVILDACNAGGFWFDDYWEGYNIDEAGGDYDLEHVYNTALFATAPEDEPGYMDDEGRGYLTLALEQILRRINWTYDDRLTVDLLQEYLAEYNNSHIFERDSEFVSYKYNIYPDTKLNPSDVSIAFYTNDSISKDTNVSPVPEPSSFLSLYVGILMTLFILRHKRNTRAILLNRF